MQSGLTRALVLLGTLPLLLSIPAAAAAQEHESSAFTSDRDHGVASNEILFFVGDTRRGGVNELTIGIDFARNLGATWGWSVFVDHARANFEREYIAGLGFFAAPLPFARDLKLFAGAGYERLRADHHHDGHWTGDNLLLGRAGATWSIHMDHDHHWVLVPQAFWDMTRGTDATVFGVGLGYHF
jgi:hypothetical protein